MSRTVLLTGGTGFVGRQVLKALALNGLKVRIVVRGGGQSQFTSSDALESIVTTPDMFAENSDWWAKVCLGIDTIIHVAWYAEPEQYLQSPKNLDCLIGTLQMAKGASQAGVCRIVGIGTCIEYELSGEKLSIDTPLRPLTPYAEAKAMTFTALEKWLPRQGIEFAWCRLFYLYGEGEDARRLVPYLHSQFRAGQFALLSSGNQVRDFLNVQEAGRLIVQVALGKQQGPINICSGIGVSIKHLAEQIADEYGRRDLLKFGVRPDNLMEIPYIVGINDFF
jgi:dTDP-6-deoxy-L-talose 4-dehydrogenase (NAD+)